MMLEVVPLAHHLLPELLQYGRHGRSVIIPNLYVGARGAFQPDMDEANIIATVQRRNG
jgi:hypothetical protein